MDVTIWIELYGYNYGYNFGCSCCTMMFFLGVTMEIGNNDGDLASMVRISKYNWNCTPKWFVGWLYITIHDMVPHI